MSKPKGLKPIEQAYLDLLEVQNYLEQYYALEMEIPLDVIATLAEKQKAALKLYRDTLYRAQRILEYGIEDE